MSIFTFTHEVDGKAISYKAASFVEATAISADVAKKMTRVNATIKCVQAGPDLIGTGATIIKYSDRDACTIVKVSKSGKSVTTQVDKATRTDGNGMSESQTYSYEAQPTAACRVYTLRSNGRWVLQGESARRGTGLAIGFRAKYHDYNF